ncbi:MAG TPA: hypothetical protein VM638_06530 [Actinomycetota bacterium]|nr:hypothetical protein [Actinomycetota bacterium]
MRTEDLVLEEQPYRSPDDEGMERGPEPGGGMEPGGGTGEEQEGEEGGTSEEQEGEQGGQGEAGSPT